MTRLRLWAVASLALALAGNSTKAGKPEGDPFIGEIQTTSRPSAADERVCTIYSLGEMGYDADLGQWIAETIPDVIEPGTWKGPGAVRYFAPKNILVVHHSAAVQAKVDRFLKELKTTRPAESKKSQRKTVVPADYRAPALLRTSSPLPDSSAYPVPAPVKAPKHLFHFLIRYEGEGIIDDNVVKFMKAQYQANKAEPKDKGATGVPATAGYSGMSSTGASDPLVSPSVAPAMSGTLAPQSSAPSVATPTTTTAAPQPTSATAAPQPTSAPVDTKEPREKKSDKKDRDTSVR